MAKYNAAKIEECEAWVAAHGLIDYGGAKLKEFVREMGIDEKTYRLWMKGKPQFKEAIERAKEVSSRILPMISPSRYPKPPKGMSMRKPSRSSASERTDSRPRSR